MEIRTYTPKDYPRVEELYRDGSTFGGQFDEARDAKESLEAVISKKPESILVAEVDGVIVGTVTLFEDGRSAWLYRCAVLPEYENEATSKLVTKAKKILKSWGHTQMLVYAPANESNFERRYTNAGFTKANDFTAYWQNL